MKTTVHKINIMLLCFIMSLMLFSAAIAAGEAVQYYDAGVITGFEQADYEQTINTEYKYALIVLRRQFPEQLTVRLSGTAYYQEAENGSRMLTGIENYFVQTVDVTWKCMEDYDEDMDVFHFVPVFEEYRIAEALEMPVITVNVLGKLQRPPLPPVHEEIFPEIPISQESLGEKTVLPTSYSSKELQKLPPVRSQAPYGLCWAFAAIAAVEADLIHDGNADTGIDLSELHLAYFTDHDFYDEKGLNIGDTIIISEGVDYLDIGGDIGRSSFALFNMLGPVAESAVPYSSASGYSPEPSSGRTGAYQITGFYFYVFSETKTDSVKKAIMDHGAVACSYNDDAAYYSATYNSYYYPNLSETNHTIAIVGWDDNFPSSNFRSDLTPPDNGAWLVRNSWGVDDYNHSGYFWLSYYDNSLNRMAYAYDVQPGRYDHVYSYDNCPGNNWYNLLPDKVSQTFYVDGSERIQAVGFYTIDSDLGLRFSVSSGDSSVTQDFTTKDPGYYLIPLSNPLTIPKRAKVTVEYTITAGDKFNVLVEQGPVEGPIGIKYYSKTGSEGLVVMSQNSGYDGRIKLFTNSLPLTTAVKIKNASGTDITGQTITINDAVYQLNAAASPEGALQTFTWTSSDTTVAEVDPTGKVTFNMDGTVTITAAASDGSGVSASTELTYIPPAENPTDIDPDDDDIITIHTDTYQLSAEADPAGAAQEITWTSSDPDTASVDAGGRVTFSKAGTVTFTAKTVDGSNIIASVTITYIPLTAAVSILNASGTNITGQTISISDAVYQLNAAASPAGAAQNFTWTSSDTTAAAVDSTGKVTFKKAGTVTITAAAADGSGKSASVTLIYEEQPAPGSPDFYRLFAERELPATGFSGNTSPGAQPRDVHYRPLDMRIMIPALNVDTELVTVPETESSWEVQWLGDRSGLLEGSALPGEGISVAAAHNTLNSTEYGPFALLGTLKVNDRIMVSNGDGSMMLFRVYANELLEPDDTERLAAVAAEGENTLVLVTCENESAEGGYLNRRVVFAGQ